ncbi:zinc finger BED domain-containing protein DAYSLEEPER-like [Diospyros lotus]|uniref:zinc finger BED domain-containing protein DAYSLEEPER-like n=1 Tax=Diospyros lotus TaxID=55363 RepID=UPI002250AF4C|nr:zinc finger BED domain-containing protein DAYSLEEPER-like [Diospyros lotus]
MGMDTLSDNNEPPSSDPQSNKRRRKKSIVWEYFTIETVDAGCTRACCKQCKKSFAYITGSKLAGTSHLKRHIALGICPVSRHNRENNQLSLYNPGSGTDGAGAGAAPPKKRHRITPGVSSIPFDQDRCYHEIAKMVILHEYPVNIVEHSGFIDFVRTLQPQFNMVSLDAIQGECVGIYLREKQSLLNLLNGSPGRVSITVDLWTSDKSIGYVFLTGHFIDANWKLHRRILNVIMIPSPDSEVAYNHAVVACLTDWGLDTKLFALTLDQSFANDSVRENLRGLLSIKNPLILNGQLLIGDCYARVLSRLARDALESMREIINKVRESVKYVITSEDIEEKFIELKQQLQVPSMKSLTIDDQTKWITTYHMLIAASELKEVFSCLDTSDPNYKEAPSMEEWKQVETLCTYLKLFFNAADILTAASYPTANTFFHEVWKIQLELMHASMTDDSFISNLIKPLQERFDKYWKDTSLVLAIGVVMDPRFKMKLVEFSFSRIYGEDAETWIKVVDEGVHELFLEYVVQSLPPPTFVLEENDNGVKIEVPHDGNLISTSDGLTDFDVYISEIASNQQVKSELDQYLEESLLPRVQEFDVLGWWKLNRLKYPTLSKMASDILAIPVSTVAPDSVFDTVGKKMDGYRSSLRPMILEALVCAKDWLLYGSSEFSNAIVKLEF